MPKIICDLTSEELTALRALFSNLTYNDKERVLKRALGEVTAEGNRYQTAASFHCDTCE